MFGALLRAVPSPVGSCARIGYWAFRTPYQGPKKDLLRPFTGTFGAFNYPPRSCTAWGDACQGLSRRGLVGIEV